MNKEDSEEEGDTDSELRAIVKKWLDEHRDDRYPSRSKNKEVTFPPGGPVAH